MFGNGNPTEHKEELSLTYSDDCSSPGGRDSEQQDFEFQISNGPIFINTPKGNGDMGCSIKEKRVISKVQRGRVISLNKPICSAKNLKLESPFTVEVSRIDACSPVSCPFSRNKIGYSNTNFTNVSKQYTLPVLEKCVSTEYR